MLSDVLGLDVRGVIVFTGTELLKPGRLEALRDALAGSGARCGAGPSMIATASLGAYTFPHDYIGEGFDTVFDRLVAAGLGSATVAVAYHTSRDVFPHNPLGMVQFLEGGVTYFEPDARRYPAPAPRPTEAALTAGTDFLERYLDAADRHGFATAAWVVGLHNTRLAMAHPDLACRTALGDPLLNALCPANPAARAYLVGLAEDVASRGFGAIEARERGLHGVRARIPPRAHAHRPLAARGAAARDLLLRALHERSR